MRQALFSLFILVIVSSLSLAQDFKEFDDGIAKFRAQDYTGVITSFSQILDNPSHNKKLDEDLYFYRGQAFFHTGEFNKVLSDLEQALMLKHYNIAVIHWYKARSFDALGKTNDAEASYKQAVSYSEKNKKVKAQILADRARFHSKNGNRQAAADDMALAKSLDSSVKEVAVQPAVTPGRSPG